MNIKCQGHSEYWRSRYI